MASAYCAIANGGTLYKPQIVNKIDSGSTDSPQLVKQFSPEIIRSNFIDEENLKKIPKKLKVAILDLGNLEVNPKIKEIFELNKGLEEIAPDKKLITYVISRHSNDQIPSFIRQCFDFE